MTGRFAEAFEYAAELHREQTRKGSEIPYLSHLMAVASLVMENGGDEDQAVAALLHDGPEDQGGRATLKEIRRRFGERVASIVEGCTDTFESPKPRWKPRKLGYLEPKNRNEFLFNVRGNQELLNKAVENHLSLPSFSAVSIAKS